MSFLPFFVTPYPDENFHSIIARYHMYAGNISRIHTYEELFGERRRNTNYKVPSHLDNLSSKIYSKKITTEMLIENHTLITFFTIFEPLRREVLKKEMAKPNSKGTTSYAGLNSQLLVSKTLQHCSMCMREDYQTFGTTYWHRMHQLPGVFVCPVHKIPLLTVKTKLMNNRDVNFILATEDHIFNPKPANIPKGVDKKLLNRYAEQAKRLLDSKICYEASSINAIYKEALKVKGYYNGKLMNRIKWYKDVKAFYGDELLKMFLSPLTNETENWLYNTLFNSITTLPLQHILIMIFLFGEDMEDFSEEIHKYRRYQSSDSFPFAAGPWPCLNPVHSDYKKNVIKEVEIRTYRNVKIGVFKCKCGFEYSKKIDDPNVKDKFKISKKLKFGSLWEKQLEKLIKQGKNKRLIAEELGVSITTIQRYASSKGLDVDQKLNIGKKSNRAMDNYQKLLYKRQKWLMLLNQNERVTTRTNRALYRWLRINDREWLLQHYQMSKQKKHKPFDWEKKDKETLEEVKNIVNNWGALKSERPQRISKALIARQTNSYGAIIHNDERMERTLSYISTIIETNEQYHLRKLEWGFEKLKKNGVTITKSKLFKIAGISGKNVWELTSKFLEDKLNE